MRIIEAPNSFVKSEDDYCIFLAGGITGCDDWQQYTIDNLISKLTDKVVLFNPRRENFPIDIKEESKRQIKWEFEMIEKCDLFTMYFAGGNSDQPICMYELGRNICRMQQRFPKDWAKRIIVTVDPSYKRRIDVLVQLELACGTTLMVGDQLDQHIDEIYQRVKYS